MRGVLFTVVVVAGCTRADGQQDRPVKLAASPAQAPGVAGPPPPAPAPTPPPVAPPAPPPSPAPAPAPATADVQVELTAVTLADDCGGAAPNTAPAPAAAARAKAAKSDMAYPGARESRRCEQTSMQLAITAADSGRVSVKSVELFDEAGTSLGTLAATRPTRWSLDRSIYEPWNQVLPANTTVHVSYVLKRPDWARVGDRWNQTFTLKTVLLIGGSEREAQKTVTLEAMAALPPNVKT
jgi:hypothetical protein